MKRTPLKRATPLKAKMPLRARAPMRNRSRPKQSAARRSAAGKECTLLFPGCTNDRETVVLCHLRMFHGGGMGLKPSDAEAVYGCSKCHDVLDGRVPWLLDDATFNFWEAIARAIVRTQRVMRASGVLVFKGEAA